MRLPPAGDITVSVFSLPISEDPNSAPKEGPCQGSYSVPAECTGDACDYTIAWTYREADDTVRFDIAARTSSDRWTGVGFSRQGQMVGTGEGQTRFGRVHIPGGRFASHDTV